MQRGCLLLMNDPTIAKLSRGRSEVEVLTTIKSMSEPLNTRLSHYVEWLASSSPDFYLAYQAFVERLQTGEFASRGPQVGDIFPSFMLPDQDGRLVSLESALNTRPLVLSFNRGHWCGLCRIELDALNEAAPDIEAAGGTLLAIIPEPQIMARKLRGDNALGFAVLSDMDLAFAASLDLVVYVGEDLRKLYFSGGIDVGAHQLTDGWFLPIPATFVIGPDGRIVARHVDPDFRRRMEVADILQALANVPASRSSADE
jgi:peroxiredoxin